MRRWCNSMDVAWSFLQRAITEGETAAKFLGIAKRTKERDQVREAVALLRSVAESLAASYPRRSLPSQDP